MAPPQHTYWPIPLISERLGGFLTEGSLANNVLCVKTWPWMDRRSYTSCTLLQSIIDTRPSRMNLFKCQCIKPEWANWGHLLKMIQRTVLYSVQWP